MSERGLATRAKGRGMFGRDKRTRLGSSPVAGRISIDKFLESGRAYVDSIGVEPDAYDIASAMLAVVQSRDPTVNSDLSELIWTDASMDVDLGHRRFIPTEFVIEVAGEVSYFVGFTGYPPFVYGGMLPDREETGPRRWPQTPPGVELDEYSTDVIRGAVETQLSRMFDPEVQSQAMDEYAARKSLRSAEAISTSVFHGPPVWVRITRCWLIGTVVCIAIGFALLALHMYGGAAWHAAFMIPLIGVCAGVPITLGMWLKERYQNRLVTAWHKSAGRLCPFCAYDVSALSSAGTCPECGKPFDIERDIPLWRDVGLRRPHDMT
ncbi:MAG: hypothetical protein KF902_00380 [Phycisphaeraceae bacterium]|nr:hypothetical protein [Phycisphaeraceae bacterium]